MSNKALPSELAHFSHLPDLAYRGSDEWSAACPKCGGANGRDDKSDRFRLFAASGGHGARCWCRRCNFFTWADQHDSKPPDPARIKQAEELRQQLAEQEARRLRVRIAELQTAAYWQGWHDAMTEQQRQLWRAQGIDDGLQDWFRLGYVDGRQFYDGERPFVSPAMTIPHFDKGWQAVNVQYRMVNPPAGVGKYRYTAGLPAPLFLTEPDRELAGPTLLLEGAKKAIVVYAHLGVDLNVIAVPSKMPGKDLIERLAECDPVYVALDPDAYQATGKSKPAVNRLARLIGSRARIVKLPCKPDDLFTRHKGNTNDFLGFLRVAARA